MSTTPMPRQGVGLGTWLLSGARRLGRDLRTHPEARIAAAIVVLIWSLAAVRLFVHHTPVLPVLFNWTESLPYKVALVDYRARGLERGDFIVYAFDGPAAGTTHPGLRHQPFFKRIAGVPGDTITVRQRDVFVNDTFVGRAKTHTFDRRALDPIEPIVIPEGHFYVQGVGVDSFDSRYAQSGLVRALDVKTRVIPLI